MKKWMKWAAGAAALTLIGVWGVSSMLGSGQADDAFAEYTRVVAERANLQVEVTGNGYVQAAEERTLYAPATAEVKAVYKKEGELVQDGEIIAALNDEVVETQIRAAKDALDSANKSLREASLTKEERRIATSVKGKVKLIAAKGNDISAVHSAYGALAYISQDDKMQVTLAAVPGIEQGAQVTLVGEYDTLQATVQQVRNAQNNTVLVVEGDDWRIQRMLVQYNGEAVGEGLLLPNRGIPIQGNHGVIKSVDVSENDDVYVSTRLFTLEKDYSERTLALFEEQQEAQRAYDAECAKREELMVRAPYEGVITSLSLAEGETVPEGVAMVSVQRYGEYEVVAAIDELDIALVEPGQSATVTLDAVRGGSFDATVLRKAAAGTYQSGVATYDVTLGLEAEKGVLAGMSAEARIEVAQRENALLLPKSLIVYRNGKPYVLTEQGEVAVTLGLASNDQVEILSGLSEGQTVLSKPDRNSIMAGFGSMGGMQQMGGN